jgi:hypothetical protein
MNGKQKEVNPIPEEFASYEEAAEFWETHDTTDYPESFETITVETKPHSSEESSNANHD